MPTALRLHAFGLDNLRAEQFDLPELGPSDVHVRFHAASLNYRDLMVVLGQYNPKMELPRIPGSDAAGEVVAVGSSVTAFKPGDAVDFAEMPELERVRNGHRESSIARAHHGLA